MSKKILFAASECAPFVKTGGLADVAAALPVQLREMGADIRVVLPLYAKIKAQFGMHMRHECDFNIKLGWRNQYCGVESLVQRGITYYFIDNEYYFGRDYIYGVFNCDEAERFGFFSKAIIEMLPHIGFMPDALHLNDWQTAMAAELSQDIEKHINRLLGKMRPRRNRPGTAENAAPEADADVPEKE